MEVNTTQNSNDMAKLQIQYSLLLKENDLLRCKQEHLIEDNRLLKVQLEKEKLESRDPLWTSISIRIDEKFAAIDDQVVNSPLASGFASRYQPRAKESRLCSSTVEASDESFLNALVSRLETKCA